ncbi:hypothetical protein NE235_14225 [Actinoallomurus spadix]|uniref:DUF4232 domain-containing protein n=1 Tax=Actinoallomurus spadix TaxID=79912 RepID=A0ABN0WEB8_9ACTN|nr:hypothetical protein [Actinoallomurus spadix]MCO5987260.1 hypothetical protein [Actinoallomurus spadix]
MDSDTHGDLGEADAYWRRRVYVLAGGITAIGLMAWACSGPDHKKPAAQVRDTAASMTPPQVTATPVVTPVAPTLTPTPTPTVTVTVTAGVPLAKPRSGDPCDEADVVVGLTSTKDVYQDKEHPRFRISVVNTGHRPCTFDVGAKALRLRITSGSDRVWSSDRCADRPASDLRVLRRGVPYIADVDWDRTRCGGDSRARPGTYVVAAKSGGVRTQSQVFRLR